jgi:hypothetical protein
MQRFSENGARPAHTLGELNAPPFGRLGALVFRPHNSDTLYWAGLAAQTRIVGCALGLAPGDTGWENVSSEDCWLRGWADSGLSGRQSLGSSPGTMGGSAARNDQFIALGRDCRGHPGNSWRQLRPPPGADASAIHGRTERSGCTAAEPYPLGRTSSLALRPTSGQGNPHRTSMT